MNILHNTTLLHSFWRVCMFHLTKKGLLLLNFWINFFKSLVKNQRCTMFRIFRVPLVCPTVSLPDATFQRKTPYSSPPIICRIGCTLHNPQPHKFGYKLRSHSLGICVLVKAEPQRNNVWPQPQVIGHKHSSMATTIHFLTHKQQLEPYWKQIKCNNSRR